MGYQSRDWRQSDPSRNYGRFRNQDESRGTRGDFDRPQGDDDWSRSAEGIGDYGGYGGQGGGYSDQRYGSGGQYGGYAEEESSYRGEHSPQRSRYSQGDWRDDRNENERYGFGSSRGESGFGREDRGRGGYGNYGRDFQSSRSGRNEGDFRTQPWQNRPMEGWSGDRYPHRDFTHGRGGDYGSGTSGRYGGSQQDWQSGSMTSSYESGYGSGSGYGSSDYGSGGYGSGGGYGSSGSGGYGSSGSSGLTNWGRGAHRGKGPKGYERSDDRLKEVICERLSDDPDIDASEISINVTSGTVRLTGTVDSRQEKYSVEEMIANCSGVKDVDNQLRVQSGRSQSGQSQRDTSSGYGTSGASSQESYGQSTSRSTSTTTGTSSSKKQ